MGLVLASRSPRRHEILGWLGVEFRSVEPDVAELGEGDPEAVVLANARRKAEAGRVLAGPDGVVLGADTEVVLGERIYGKPATVAEAEEMLRSLSGQTHTVFSAVVLLDPDGRERAGISETAVAFRDLGDELLGDYLASGEWRDRAGAYAIQGLGSILIARIEGDFSNVVGLPVPLLLDLAPEIFRPNR